MQTADESLQPGRAAAAPARARSPARRDRSFIEPLARGLSVLQAFTAKDTWLGNLEVASRVDLPNATVNRMMKTLTALGYLTFSRERRQYRLAAPVLSLGYAAVANSNIRQVMHAHMQDLADRFNVFVMLGERDRLDIVLLEVCHSNSSILTLRLEQGARVPIGETAVGWALMAALPESEQDYLMTHMKRRYGDRWPSVERNIARALAQARRFGYCASLGAWRQEITTVALPLVLADRSSALVLACASAAPYLPSGRIAQEIGPTLVALAKRMGKELSGQDA